jgi:hypothetical protein
MAYGLLSIEPIHKQIPGIYISRHSNITIIAEDECSILYPELDPVIEKTPYVQSRRDKENNTCPRRIQKGSFSRLRVE